MIHAFKRWLQRQGFSERAAAMVMLQALVLAIILVALGVKIWITRK